MNKLSFICGSAGRADSVIASETGLSRNRIQHLIEDGSVTINENTAKSNSKIKTGDIIEVVLPDPKPTEILPQDIPLDIIYEDDFLAVINKTQGMVVHPSAGHEDGTLVNAIMFKMKGLSSIGGVERPGIVHRIDKMTSGLLVIAKNDFIHQSLSEQFSVHSARREYLTVAMGNFKENFGKIDAPIGRSFSDRKKMAIVKDGKTAVSHWEVLERFGNYTFLKMKLETGRTHQIRVHLASIGHPVVGDQLYSSGKNPFGLEGQALHGYKLEFVHPETEKPMRFFAPIPDYFSAVLRRLGSSYPIYELFN